jgi:hypothetical protein
MMFEQQNEFGSQSAATKSLEPKGLVCAEAGVGRRNAGQEGDETRLRPWIVCTVSVDKQRLRH